MRLFIIIMAAILIVLKAVDISKLSWLQSLIPLIIWLLYEIGLWIISIIIYIKTPKRETLSSKLRKIQEKQDKIRNER